MPFPLHNAKKRSAGFTLVEVLVVIILIAVLAAIVIPQFTDSIKRGKEASLKSDLKMLRNAVTLFKEDTGLYPTSLAHLKMTNLPPNGNDGANQVSMPSSAVWHGPYVFDVPVDPVSGVTFGYVKTQGRVISSAAGTANDGSLYSEW